MSSHPVWCLFCRIWLTVTVKRLWKSKIHLITFVRIGPKMPYTNFHDNRSKIVTRETFFAFSTFFKMAENLSWRKLTSWGALNSAWSKDSKDAKFLKIGCTVQKLHAEMYLQLWPVGGARGVELATWSLLKRIMGLSRRSVQNFTTFYHTVLWAAIETTYGRKMLKKKTYKHNRCLRSKAAWP